MRIRKKNYKLLEKVSYSFFHKDEWLKEFIDWFKNEENSANEALIQLVKSDLISERTYLIKSNLEKLLLDWRNLKVESDFPEKLFEIVKEVIGLDNLSNLDFYCELLKEFDRYDLADILEKEIKAYIDQNLEQDFFFFGFNKNNQFHTYAKEKQEESPFLGVRELIDIVYFYTLHNGWNNPNDSLRLKVTTVDDWVDLFFNQIPQDERFNNTNLCSLIKKMLNQQIDLTLNDKIRKDIFLALDKKAQESKIMYLNVRSIKKRLEI